MANGFFSALEGRGGSHEAENKDGLSSLAVRPHGDSNHLLVVVFLRGGADGLNIVAPYGDDAYYEARPTLAIAAPKTGVSVGGRLIPLAGRFGLHPSLSRLLPLWDEGQMAAVTAVGSSDHSLSHFEASALLERGDERGAHTSGWLARHLSCTIKTGASPLRGIAIGEQLPASLLGAPQATALLNVNDLALSLPSGVTNDEMISLLDILYRGYPKGEQGLVTEAGREAVNVLRVINRIRSDSRSIAVHTAYKGDFGDALKQVATLAKAEVGVEVACVDQWGYDTHVAQGANSGIFAGLLEALGGGLATFAADLGPSRWARTTVVVLSEFGRRVEENSGFGTDHGRAGAMLVLGGGIVGGKVYGNWPGMLPGDLDENGNLRVTTDYRIVLAEILTHRVGNPNVSTVFPGLNSVPLGVCHA